MKDVAPVTAGENVKNGKIQLYTAILRNDTKNIRCFYSRFGSMIELSFFGTKPECLELLDRHFSHRTNCILSLVK